jgi:hypothetical protein
MDRGQAGVAAASAVAAVVFEVVEERADQLRVDILDLKPSRCRADPARRELHKHPQRVAVGGHGVWAGVLLPSEAFGEEGLQGRGERGHDVTPG